VTRRTRDYRLPREPGAGRSGRVYRVDAGLPDAALDRLNRLPGLEVVSTCEGHPRHAHILFSLAPGVLHGPALERRVRLLGAGAGLEIMGVRLSSGPAPGWYWRIAPSPDPPPFGGPRWFTGAVEVLARAIAEQDGAARITS